LTEEGHSRLSQIFDQCNEKSFAPIFAICAKEAADLAEHGDNSVGIMLMVQFLVKRQSESSSGPNMVMQSLPMVVNNFYTPELFPTDRNLVSIVRTYTQSVKIPTVYIRFWVQFFLFARPDKQAENPPKNEPVIYGASKNVAKLATSYFGLVFDASGGKKLTTIVNDVFSGPDKEGKVALRAPLRPQELWFLLVLAHGDTPDGANKEELLRAIPYFLHACVEKAAVAYFADLLPYFSKAPIQQLRDFFDPMRS